MSQPVNVRDESPANSIARDADSSSARTQALRATCISATADAVNVRSSFLRIDTSSWVWAFSALIADKLTKVVSQF